MPEIRFPHLGLSQRALVATTTPSRSTPLRWRARRRAARAASCSATTPPSSCDSGASRRERRCATTPCVPAVVPAPPASASSPRRVLPQRRSAGAPRLSGRPLAPRQPRRRRAGGAWCKGYTCTCAPRVTRRRQPHNRKAKPQGSAIPTGGQVVSEDVGIKLDDGHARHVQGDRGVQGSHHHPGWRGRRARCSSSA